MTQRQQPPEKRKRVFTPAATRDTETEPASSHRAGHFAGLHAEDTPYTTTADVQQHFKRPAYEPDELEANQRMTAIQRRYNGIQAEDGVIVPDANGQDGWYFHKSPVPLRARAVRGDTTEAPRHVSKPPTQKLRRRFRPLFFVGVLLLVMILGFVVFNTLGSWWNTVQNNDSYGYPRTFQIDAVVGHSDSEAHPSHFIALNLRGHILILEIPGGNVSKAIIYSGPVLLGPGQDATPVTLSFADTTGNGKLDTIVHIDTSTLVFLNNGTKFVPPSNLISGGSYPPTQGA